MWTLSIFDWVAAVYLSQDPIGIEEITNGHDLHTANQAAFGLPSRLIAKVFLFRIIFGGSAFSFARDPDFASVGFSASKWEAVIERFYSKYKGIKLWHDELISTATTTGHLSIPTGRQWTYELTRDKRGELKWPTTTMKNYPVQGLEADLMMIMRVSLFNRIKHEPLILLVNSVHDSIVIDCPDKLVSFVIKTINDVLDAVPLNFKKLFGVEFNLPFRGEISVGQDWQNMEEVK
jgi:DNA polymerase I-like protein with 3'-5' exonuclease and polymerase domains